MPFGSISALVPSPTSSTYFKYACGLKLGPALTLNPNPIFEMASELILTDASMLFIEIQTSPRSGSLLVVSVSTPVGQ